jgi:hypothetical protein
MNSQVLPQSYRNVHSAGINYRPVYSAFGLTVRRWLVGSEILSLNFSENVYRMTYTFYTSLVTDVLSLSNVMSVFVVV